MADQLVTVIDGDGEDEGIATLHMCDAAGKNAFSHGFVEAMLAALSDLSERDDLRALILRGLPDVFAAGAEKQALLNLCDGKVHVKDLALSEELVKFPVPVVAAMEGHGVGGGLVLGLCCDVMVMARESRYGAAFMAMGFTPGMGCTALLPEAFGPFVAAEMMYTGRRFKGRQLAERGLVNYVVPRAEVLATARDVAVQIAEKPRTSLIILKETLALRKRQLLAKATADEDHMHRISFNLPGMRDRIDKSYHQ